MPDSGIMGRAAAGHPLTAQTGTDMLRAGGGFMPLRKPHGSARLLDAFARMPHIDAHDSKPHDFNAMPVGFDHSVQTLHIGRASAALCRA